MPNHKPHIRQSLHMHCDGGWRQCTLHIHMDSASSLLGHIYYKHHIGYMLAEGQLFDQQHRKEH